MKTFKIFSVVAATMLFSMLLSSCAKEEAGQSVQIEQKTLKAGSAPFTWTDDVCPGDPMVLTLVGDGNKQIQQLINGLWTQIAQDNGGSVPLVATVEDVELTTYVFRYKVGSGGFSNAINITILPCCDPGFTYVDNGNNTYTFTLVPEVDMENAELIFTFAQSAYISGLPLGEGWARAGNDGQVMKTTMDLVGCETYTWTVTLQANCSGNSGQSNVWTDFKIGEESQKGSLPNIVIPCN
jgi:hypothetical protein